MLWEYKIHDVLCLGKTHIYGENADRILGRVGIQDQTKMSPYINWATGASSEIPDPRSQGMENCQSHFQ